MNLPGKPSNPSEPTFGFEETDETEFKQALREVESSLQNLKERYLQVQAAKQYQAELHQRLHQLQAELSQIRETLEALEIDLESRLFSWGSQREAFWQVVRFVGLGIVIGLLLKACSG